MSCTSLAFRRTSLLAEHANGPGGRLVGFSMPPGGAEIDGVTVTNDCAPRCDAVVGFEPILHEEDDP